MEGSQKNPFLNTNILPNTLPLILPNTLPLSLHFLIVFVYFNST